MSDWLVYQAEGSHVGPVTTELLARGLAAGRVGKDAHVAPAGTTAWQPVLEVDDVVRALDALALETDPAGASPLSGGLATVPPAPPPPSGVAVPEAPRSEADPTEVIRRDESLHAALGRVREARAVSAPKPPTPPSPPRTSTAPPPPLPNRPSGTIGIAPSRPSVPPAPPPPSIALQAATPLVVPPPPDTLTMLQQPPPPGPAPLGPAPLGPAPLGPPASLAPPAPPPPPAEQKPAEEPKKPVVDPKLALALPLGVFGVFLALTLLVVLYAAVIRPRLGGGARGADSSVTPP